MIYDFSAPATYEELIKLVSEEDILYHYYGEYEIDTLMPCPFREETRPSFMISYVKGKLKWIRYGIIDRYSSPVDLVRIKYKLAYHDAIQKIYEDLFLQKKAKGIVPKEKKERKHLLQSPEYVENFEEFELEYWKQYHFSKETLLEWNVYPCTRYWIGDKVWHSSKKGDPLFVYIHDELKQIWTGYRPLGPPEEKFKKHNVSSHIMGLDKIPFLGDYLFITSSYKDIITLSLLGYPAIAPHSERSLIPSELIKSLKLTFKHIYVAYDNDATGVAQSIELTKIHNLRYWNTPKGEPKDPSDYSKEYSLEKLKQSIDEKIKRDEKL